MFEFSPTNMWFIKKNSLYKKVIPTWSCMQWKLKLFLLMNVSNFFVDIYFGEEVLYACVWFFPFLWHPLTQAFRAMIIFHLNNLQLHIFFSYLIRGFILRLIFILQMLKEKKVYKVFHFFRTLPNFGVWAVYAKLFHHQILNLQLSANEWHGYYFYALKRKTCLPQVTNFFTSTYIYFVKKTVCGYKLYSHSNKIRIVPAITRPFG